VFLAAGHGIEEDSVYAAVQMASGHSRQRRRWTVPERVVSVSWLLKGEAQIAEVDEWFDITLEAGALPFSAQVANQGSGSALLWWRARWLAGWQFEMIPGGFCRVTGQLFLTGEGSEDGPDPADTYVTADGEAYVTADGEPYVTAGVA